MELYQVAYFLAVCETLNFTRASEACFVSQPSLTKAIQKLEDALGGRLFDRTRNCVRLTPLGQTMRPHLAHVHNAVRRARNEAKTFLNEEPIPLAIGVMCTISLENILRLRKTFEKSHPYIGLRLCSLTLAATYDALDGGEISTAIAASPKPFPNRFDALALYRENFVVACSPDHPLMSRPHMRLADLHGASYLSRQNCEFNDHFQGLLGAQGIKVRVEHTSDRGDWIESMIRAGLGVALMPEATCRSASLSFCALVDPPIARDVHLLKLRDRPETEAVHGFTHEVSNFGWKSSTS